MHDGSLWLSTAPVAALANWTPFAVSPATSWRIWLLLWLPLIWSGTSDIMRVIDLEYGIPLLISLSSCCWFVLLSSMWLGSDGIACTNSGIDVALAVRPNTRTTVQAIILFVLGWLRVLPCALFLLWEGVVGLISESPAAILPRPTIPFLVCFSLFG